MKEGWYNDDHLILFNEAEVLSASDRYGISNVLPGFQIIGLRGWDDFLVRDDKGSVFTVPTLPLDAKYLAPFSLPSAEISLQEDSRFAGKIKWYLTPVVFGGDPKSGENIYWVNHDLHAQLVRWWNDKYRAIVGG